MKDGFMLYCSHYPTIKKLSNEDKGKLLDAVFQYNINGMDPEIDSFPVELSFSFLKQQFDRDQEKYQNVVDRNKKNIEKRWEKKDTKNTSGIIGSKKDTKNTDKDYDKEKDKDYDKEKDNLEIPLLVPQGENVFPFDKVWSIYDKKVGDKEKLKRKWDKLSVENKTKALDHIQRYVASTQKQYRKNFETYLNASSWEDEIIESPIPSKEFKPHSIVLHQSNEPVKNF